MMHSGLCNLRCRDGWEPRLASATISFTGLCQTILISPGLVTYQPHGLVKFNANGYQIALNTHQILYQQYLQLQKEQDLWTVCVNNFDMQSLTLMNEAKICVPEFYIGKAIHNKFLKT